MAIHFAEALAARGIRTWMFETDIEYRGSIAHCVRAAIEDTACCAALVTRDSIASLWVLTELHTALQLGKPAALVIDATDALLLDLLRSVRFSNLNLPFDQSVKFSASALTRLHKDYDARESASRSNRYQLQARDFLATLPTYLHQWTWPAFAFPDLPSIWEGPIQLAPIEDLSNRILTSHSQVNPES